MKKTLTGLAILAGLATMAQTASAQDLLAGKTAYTLGDAKTWTGSNESTYTFNTEDLAKLTAEPTNKENIFLFPEAGGVWNTDANKAIGIQGFYVDMETSQAVGTVSTTWEGAAASAYSIYLTDEVPTTAILETTPTYSATNLGQYQSNTAVLPDGSKGRYLVFQPTDATNWGWGVKIRSISAGAPQADELTIFTVAPAIVQAGEETDVTMTFKNQLGLDIAADKVNVTVSDNATYADGKLIVNSGTEAVFTATMGNVEMTATVYVATAPEVPAASAIKTPVFTNTVTEYNDKAGWVADYNGGAVNNGTLTFADGEVAQSFANTRCVFFYNSETTGAWNGSINPTEKGYRSLHLDIFGTKDCQGAIEFEGTSGVIEHTQNFTLEAGKWNAVDITLTGETKLNNMSVRFNEENMCDILLANIYFTPAYVEGDETAPVLSEVTAAPAKTSVTLSFSATDDLSTDVYYTITDGEKTWRTSGKSGEKVEYTVTGLTPSTDYNFAVTANDGKNISEAKTVEVTTTGMPDAPTPTQAADKVIAVYSAHYDADAIPAFDNWGSTAAMGTTETDGGETVLSFSNYNGQWGGLIDLNIKLSEGAEYLHLDIFGDATEGTIAVGPVWDGHENTPSKTLTVEADKWNSYDIDLTEFGFPSNGLDVIQLALTESTLGNFSIDNFYFWSNSVLSAIESIQDSEDANVDVYTIQGSLVRTGVSGSEATLDLAPGLYIIGGRKVLVK